MEATSTDVAYNFIRSYILDGRFYGGLHLREEELAHSLGSSRTPVREALRLLDAEGLVEITPHRGARVSSWSDEEIRETYALRFLLEGEAARRAAPRISDDSISKMADLCDRMESVVRSEIPDRFSVLADLNNTFHRTVHESSGDALLSSTLSSIVTVSMVRNTFSTYSATELSRSLHHHRELLEALERRDSDWAEAIMRCHIQSARWVTKARVSRGSIDPSDGTDQFTKHATPLTLGEATQR
jgi:DNA-binding GntR family transcriptional regulator